MGILRGFVVVLVFTATTALAGKELPYSEQTIQYLQDKYFDGKILSQKKLNSVFADLEARRKAAAIDTKHAQQFDKKRSPEEAAARAEKSKGVQAWDIMMGEKFQAILRAKSYAEAIRAAHELEVIWGAMRRNASPNTLAEAWREIKNVLRTHEAQKARYPEDEASNLFRDNSYLDLNDIKDKQNLGADLSLYNPGPESPFWQKPADIKAIDIIAMYQGNQAPMYAGIDVVFPQGSAQYDSVRTTATKPKLNIEFKGEKGKEEAKLKFGEEAHAQPTATALAMALGFHADSSRHVKNFRMEMGGKNINQMKAEWNRYFQEKAMGRHNDVDVDTFIAEQGDDYIIFKEAAVTAQPKDLVRLEGWSYAELGHADLREVRGMNLFNIWIHNTDAKQYGNNKVVLKKTQDGGHEVYQYQHDIGASFGRIQPEKLNAFDWTAVKKVGDDYVEFEFISKKGHDGHLRMTYADAKWMTRLIAQLTPKQIRDAVSLGGWPESAAKILELKLIARRNSLVKAFGLEGESLSDGTLITTQGEYDVDQNFTSESGQIVDGKLLYCDDPNLTVDFCHYTRHMLAPYGTAFGRLISLIGRNTFELADRYSIDPLELGLDDAIIASVIYENAREIEENPSPTGRDDLFLVKDSFRIGFRFGAGLFLTGEATYWKSYTLVYPMPNFEEARNSRSFFVDLLMPFRLAANNLPKRFVLVREDYVDGRGRLRSTVLNLGPAIDFRGSKIHLDRAIIVRNNDDDAILYEDTTISTRASFRFYLGVLVGKLPFVVVEKEWGELNGVGYLIDTSELSDNPQDSASIALQKAINFGDFGDIRAAMNDPTNVVKKLNVTSYFEAPRSLFTFFGLFSFTSDLRTDRMHLMVADHRDSSEWEADELQINFRSRHNALLKGERHDVVINGFAGILFDEKKVESLDEPVIKMKITVTDNEAMEKELDDGHKLFVNKLADPASDEPMIAQVFTGGSENASWEGIELTVEQYLYVDAIEKLVELGENDTPLWMALAESAGLDSADLYFYKDTPKHLIPEPLKEVVSRGRQIVDHCRNALEGRSKGKQKLRKTMLKKRNSAAEYRLSEVLLALDAALYRNDESFDGTVLGGLNRYLGYENIFIRARLSPLGKNKMPIGSDYVAEAGAQRAFNSHLYLLNLDPDPTELWTAFDWLR